jgi:4-amino-4-deoxy-L-arabinose transferase-like glycosyltransferase
VSLLAAIAISKIMPYYHEDEYADSAMEMVRTGHIYYNFLPIGYPALLAFGYKVFGGETGFIAVNIVLSLLMLASAWLYLRLTGLSVKLTLLVVVALSIYPDFSLSYNKTQDTNITAIVLFSFMSAMILMSRAKNRFGYPDILVGATLGIAALIRPNMLLLVPVSWLVFYHSKVRGLISRALIQLTTAAVVYCSITVLVHGSMFFPRNGPYNLYSGYNPYTSQHLWNEEDSIPLALAAQHIHYTDNRDPMLDSIYERSALAFIHDNPGQAAKLVPLKFGYMMLPDLHVHPANSLAGFAKIVSALAIPLWIALSFFGGKTHGHDTRLLITSVLIAIVLPFCLIISTQRFRIPLDFICWTDLGAIVLLRQSSLRTFRHRASESSTA